MSALAQSADRRHLFYTVNEAGLSGLFLLDTTTGVTPPGATVLGWAGVVVDEMNHISFRPIPGLSLSPVRAARAFDVFVWDVEQDVIRR